MLVQGEQLFREIDRPQVDEDYPVRYSYLANELERYVYYYFYARSASAYVFSTYDREDNNILLAQSFRDHILLEYL